MNEVASSTYVSDVIIIMFINFHVQNLFFFCRHNFFPNLLSLAMLVFIVVSVE